MAEDCPLLSTLSDKKCRAKLAKVAKGTLNLTADYADSADKFGLQRLFWKSMCANICESSGCGRLSDIVRIFR